MPVYTGPDQTSAALLAALEAHVVTYKSLDGKLTAAEGDLDTAIQNWIETSEEPKAVSLREAIKKANEQLKTLAEKNVKVDKISDEEKAKLQEEAKAIGDKIRGARKAIENVAKTLGGDVEGVLKALDEIGDPTKSNRGRKPGSAGSALPRASVNLVLSGGGMDNKHELESFSEAAKMTLADVEDIQKAFAAAAGVDHHDIKSAFDKAGKKSIEFDFEAGDRKYHAVATPKPRAPRGSKKEEQEPMLKETNPAAVPA